MSDNPRKKPPSKFRYYYEVVAIVVLAVFVVATRYGFEEHPNSYDDWRIYIVMADDPSYGPSPFNARILVPLAVHLMPCNHIEGFFLISISSIKSRSKIGTPYRKRIN